MDLSTRTECFRKNTNFIPNGAKLGKTLFHAKKKPGRNPDFLSEGAGIRGSGFKEIKPLYEATAFESLYYKSVSTATPHSCATHF
jgi:hypothetical protein